MSKLTYYEANFDSTNWLKRKKDKINDIFSEMQTSMLSYFGNSFSNTSFYKDFEYINNAHNNIYNYVEEYKKEYNDLVNNLSNTLTNLNDIKGATDFVSTFKADINLDSTMDALEDINDVNEYLNEATNTLNVDSEYNRLVNLLTKNGYSKIYAKKILKQIKDYDEYKFKDSLTTVLNYYESNPEDFKKKFNIPLYINVNGKKVPNTGEILLYYEIESNKNPDTFFKANNVLLGKQLDNSGTNLKSGKILDLSKGKKMVVEGDDDYRILEGSCYANGYYIVSFINPYEDENGIEKTKTMLKIYDKKGNEVNKITEIKSLGHTNGMTYDPKTKTVSIVNGKIGEDETAQVYQVKLDKLSSAKKEEDLDIKVGTATINKKPKRASGIAIDTTTNDRYVSSGQYIYKVNEKREGTQIVKAATGTTQDIYANNGKLYVIRYNRENSEENIGVGDNSNAARNIIDIYDNKGKYEKSIPIKTPKGSRNELESLSTDGDGNLVLFMNNHVKGTDPAEGSIITISKENL